MQLIRGQVTANRLICGIAIAKTSKSIVYDYNALIDTGATHSCITEKVVQDLQLEAIGKTVVHNTTGSHETSRYRVHLVLYWTIRLQSSPGHGNLTQENLEVVSIAESPHYQAIIGMDIIGRGFLNVAGGSFQLGWETHND